MHWMTSRNTDGPRTLHLTTQTLACDVLGWPDKHRKAGLNNKDVRPNLVNMGRVLLHGHGTAHVSRSNVTSAAKIAVWVGKS
jgi:hypothetical protein